jgi:hypothetical protein
LARLHGLRVVSVQDEPGDDLCEVVGRPFSSHVGFRETNWTIEDAPLEEILITHLDARLDTRAEAPVDATGAIRKDDFEAAEFEFGEAIENEAAEKHVSR